MELGIQVKEENHKSVSHDGHCRDAQDQKEEEDVGGAMIKDSQQYEIRIKGLKFPCHEECVL